MNLTTRFRINSPKIVHETIDEEVIILNLNNGNYYSLDKVGACVWSFVESGATVSETVEAIARRYDGTCVDMESAVNQLMAELQQENLIVPDEAKEPGCIKGLEVRSGTEGLVFEAPILHKYTDMQDLLLLDPIHEVDETGWPTVKLDSSHEDE
jgi:hypothetical protein